MKTTTAKKVVVQFLDPILGGELFMVPVRLAQSLPVFVPKPAMAMAMVRIQPPGK